MGVSGAIDAHGNVLVLVHFHEYRSHWSAERVRWVIEALQSQLARAEGVAAKLRTLPGKRD
jgi:hypothetical protein